MASNEYETIRQATATFADILRTLSESYAPMLNELRETVAVSLEIQSNVLQALESFKPELAKVLESMDTYKSISQELSELINEKIIKSYSAIDYSALIKSIRDITIQETFVSVPESLISNVPQHEWDISSDIHSAQQAPVMRQLSITNAKRFFMIHWFYLLQFSLYFALNWIVSKTTPTIKKLLIHSRNKSASLQRQTIIF